jgi:outer membrane beta-barrel protein
VIQDRKYNKQGRLEFGVDLGMTTASSFFNTYTFGARGAYYLNEYWGIQGFANYSLSTDSEEKRQLENFLVESNFNSSKEFLKPRLFTGLGVLWNPIYGKFAWFRSRIIHFDIYGGLGLSYLTMESEFNKPAAGQGTQRASSSQGSVGTLANLGIRIYLNKNMAWTTEARNNIYKATYQATTTGGGGGNIAAKDVWQNNFQFVTGVSYLFNIGGY